MTFAQLAALIDHEVEAHQPAKRDDEEQTGTAADLLALAAMTR